MRTHEKLFDIIDANAREYIWQNFGKERYPENRSLREAQYNILQQQVQGGTAIEVMSGEGVASLLAVNDGLLDRVILVENNKDAIGLLKLHVKSLDLKSKVLIKDINIDNINLEENFNYCLAICTEIFNPNPGVYNVFGNLYIPPQANVLLQKAKKISNKIIVMEAVPENTMSKLSFEHNIYFNANLMELNVTTGMKKYSQGELYWGVFEK